MSYEEEENARLTKHFDFQMLMSEFTSFALHILYAKLVG